MSIKDSVDDALLLHKSGRELGALSLLLIAVAGSSRKVFPKPVTKSRQRPKETMRDGEAFTLFLNGRLHRLLFEPRNIPDSFYVPVGVSFEFRGKSTDLAEVLYEHFRCNLIHESALPHGIVFADTKAASPTGASISLQIQGDDIVLGNGWIDVLVKVVKGARCNAAEFGVTYFDAVPRDEFNANSLKAELHAAGLTPARFDEIAEASISLRGQNPETFSDAKLAQWFKWACSSGLINEGVLRGVVRAALADEDAKLTEAGVSAVRRIVNAFEIVEAAK